VKIFSLYDVVWFLVNLIFTTVIASAVVVDDYGLNGGHGKDAACIYIYIYIYIYRDQ
jgi:hypothetical protein